MKTNHTEGPWYAKTDINAHGQGLIISEKTGANIAVVYSGEDANIIAAAPEMLNALIEIANENESRLLDGISDRDELLRCAGIARAAIANARGE